MSEEKFKNLSDLMGKNVKATESEKSKKKTRRKILRRINGNTLPN